MGTHTVNPIPWRHALAVFTVIAVTIAPMASYALAPQSEFQKMRKLMEDLFMGEEYDLQQSKEAIQYLASLGAHHLLKSLIQSENLNMEERKEALVALYLEAENSQRALNILRRMELGEKLNAMRVQLLRRMPRMSSADTARKRLRAKNKPMLTATCRLIIDLVKSGSGVDLERFYFAALDDLAAAKEINALQKIVEDKRFSDEQRAEAVSRLGSIGTGKILEELIKRNDLPFAVRHKAIYCLRGDSVKNMLGQLAEDVLLPASLRVNALARLTDIKAYDIVEPLVQNRDFPMPLRKQIVGFLEDVSKLKQLVQNNRIEMILRREALCSLRHADASDILSIFSKDERLPSILRTGSALALEHGSLEDPENQDQQKAIKISRRYLKMLQGDKAILDFEQSDDLRKAFIQLLQAHKLKIAIDLPEIAEVRAALCFIEAMGLNQDTVILTYGDEIDAKEAKKHFPAYRIKAAQEFDAEDDNHLGISFTDEGFVVHSADEYGLDRFPFKQGLPDPLSDAGIRNIKGQLGLGEGPGSRKVIVAGSPEDDLYGVLTAYDNSYGGLAMEQRPLLIIAPRREDVMADIESKSILARQGVKIRNDSDAPFEDMRKHNVLILNTRGELLNLYAIGDVCIVGHDHNIFEPASQGKPTLYLGTSWQNNEKARRILVEAGAALTFSQRNLENILRGNSSSMGKNGLRAVKKFKETIVPRAARDVTNILLLALYLKVSDKMYDQAPGAMGVGVSTNAQVGDGQIGVKNGSAILNRSLPAGMKVDEAA